MDVPVYAIQINIPTIEIYKNEYLTIWADNCSLSRFQRGDKREQLDVRITKDGKIEIFCHLDKVKVMDFNDWYSCEEKN